MNKDILIEKIEYLSSMPHSNLVQHCIYLENENANYKAQKYITDFISENGIICEKNKEIERLNNIINSFEKRIITIKNKCEQILTEAPLDVRINERDKINLLDSVLKHLEELKEGKE